MLRTGKKFSKPALSRVINGDTQLKSAPEAPAKTRLDLLLVEDCPQFNRSTLQSFIKDGCVTVNGKIIKKPNYEVSPSASVVLKVPEKQSAPDLKDILLYEDEDCLVINKPAGLLSMTKGQYTPEPTLEDYGLLVHRLDRGTSGVVILAKNEKTQSFLRRQFQDRRAHKTYYAIVAGIPKLPSAKIDLPITRSLKHPTTFEVSPNGKPSQTFYRVVSTRSISSTTEVGFDSNINNKAISLLELKPITGRTHQLRVHLKYLGHPIIGDPIYSDIPAPRLFLHANSLEITIPGIPYRVRKTFTAPLPESFLEVFPSLRKNPAFSQSKTTSKAKSAPSGSNYSEDFVRSSL